MPRYFDLQVNGYFGVDFCGDDIRHESLAKACAQLCADNVTGILATVITDDIQAMCRRLARIAELRQQDA